MTVLAKQTGSLKANMEVYKIEMEKLFDIFAVGSVNYELRVRGALVKNKCHMT